MRKKYTNLLDEHQQVLKSLRAMGTLSAQLADSERAGRALEQQLASTLLEKNELRDQIQAINVKASMATCRHDLQYVTHPHNTVNRSILFMINMLL